MDWREKVRAEIYSLQLAWAEKYGWNPQVREHDEWIDLYVQFTSQSARSNGPPVPPHQFVLRLRYRSDFETAGRQEAFVNSKNWEEEGPHFWPTGARGINPTSTPPFICLEGTWGFHSVHHRERDGRRANLNKLLIEIQKCLNE